MKTSLLSSIFVVFACIFVAEAACPAKFVQVSNYCFHFSVHSKSFDNAFLSCSEMGGNLATISDSAKMLAIVNYVTKYNYLNSWWIGANDLARQNQWVWAGTGKSVQFAYWCKGNPHMNDPYNRCAEITNNPNRCWQAAPCSNTQQYICEPSSK